MARILMKMYDNNSPDYRKNVFGISSAEFFWGLSLPVLFESTFLQLFLKSIGASNRTIGLVPALISAGMMLFGIAAAYITSHLAEKRKAVIITHATASLPVIIFGALLPFVPPDSRVTLFMSCYVSFSLLLGLTLPIWQNFLVKIFKPEMTVKALSIMMTVQMGTRFIGSIIIFRVVKNYNFSINSTSVIFFSAGLFMLIGAFMFYFTREQVILPDVVRKHHDFLSLLNSARVIISNRNYMLYMYSFVESHATIALLSFYANFAVLHRGIDSATAAGIFAAVIYTASFMANITLGWMDLLPLKLKITAARISSIAGTLILLIASSMQLFIVASFLFGISRGVNQFTYAPGVKRLSGADDATDYFAISSVLIFPFAFGIPFLSGLVLDRSGGGADAFIGVFTVLLVFQLAGLAAIIFSDFKSAV